MMIKNIGEGCRGEGKGERGDERIDMTESAEMKWDTFSIKLTEDRRERG